MHPACTVHRFVSCSHPPGARPSCRPGPRRPGEQPNPCCLILPPPCCGPHVYVKTPMYLHSILHSGAVGLQMRFGGGAQQLDNDSRGVVAGQGALLARARAGGQAPARARSIRRPHTAPPSTGGQMSPGQAQVWFRPFFGCFLTGFVSRARCPEGYRPGWGWPGFWPRQRGHLQPRPRRPRGAARWRRGSRRRRATGAAPRPPRLEADRLRCQRRQSSAKRGALLAVLCCAGRARGRAGGGCNTRGRRIEALRARVAAERVSGAAGGWRRQTGGGRAIEWGAWRVGVGGQ
jgi:hypothetical protein